MMQQEEGKAIPDWQYVKSELLQSSFNADVIMAEYIAGKKRDYGLIRDAEKWIIDLYLKLRHKIDTDKKEYKVLLVLKDHIYKETPLTFIDLMDCLDSLNKRLEELGVTKIELPQKKKMKNPLV